MMTALTIHPPPPAAAGASRAGGFVAPSVTARSASPTPLEEQQHIVLSNISWETYCRLVDDLGDERVAITYDDGRAELMSPLPGHDPWGRQAWALLRDLGVELGMEVFPLGGATFRSQRMRKGLEPDESFYIQNIEAIRRLIDEGRHYDDERDPPPDLVIEIEVSRRVLPKMPIYAALGVPEVWRHDGTALRAMILRDADYVESPHSLAFPMLAVADFAGWVDRSMRELNTTFVPAFRGWARSLKP